MATELGLYSDRAVCIMPPRNAVSHALYMASFLLSSHPAGVYDTWTTQIAPHFLFPPLRTFPPSSRTWSKVEQLPPPESVTCPPQRPSPSCLYTCVRTIQLRRLVTSQNHFGEVSLSNRTWHRYQISTVLRWRPSLFIYYVCEMYILFWQSDSFV